MKKITTTFYRLPIDSIPFKEIPSLESLNYRCLYCSSYPIKEFMGSDFYLVSVFNAFDCAFQSVIDIEAKPLLFGEVLSIGLPLRGATKAVKVGSVSNIMSSLALPDLKYHSSSSNPINGNWFYMKEGKYLILHGIKSDYEKVKHLESIALYGENIIRLRVVIELLKKNVKDGILKLTEKDYNNIAYKVLRSDPSLSKTDDETIWDGVNNWLPSMLSMPLYEDILAEKRGKVDN